MNEITDEVKRSWVDLRRNIIAEQYDLPEAEQARADEYFSRVERLALECADQGEFERRFGESPLAVEYNQLFSDFMNYNRSVQSFGGEMKKIQRENMKSAAIDTAKSQAKRTMWSWFINILPNSISDWFVYRENNIPVVREVRDWKNKKDLMRRSYRGEWNGEKPEEPVEKLPDEKDVIK